MYTKRHEGNIVRGVLSVWEVFVILFYHTVRWSFKLNLKT